MKAIGILDDDHHPWCTVWSSDQLLIARLVAESIMNVRTTVDASFDAVIRAVHEGKDDGKVGREEEKGRLMAGLSINAEKCQRVKLHI